MKSHPVAMALVSIAIGALAYTLFVFIKDGAFTDNCGDYRLGCFFDAVLTLGIGCLAGLIPAIVSHRQPGTHGWLSTLGLLINSAPFIAVAVWFISISLP